MLRFQVGATCPDSTFLYYFKCCDFLTKCCFRLQVPKYFNLGHIFYSNKLKLLQQSSEFNFIGKKCCFASQHMLLILNFYVQLQSQRLLTPIFYVVWLLFLLYVIELYDIYTDHLRILKVQELDFNVFYAGAMLNLMLWRCNGPASKIFTYKALIHFHFSKPISEKFQS